MKIIHTNLLFKGYKACNLFGILLVRPGTELTPVNLNHERIHTAQMKEMLYIGFYLWYGIEYIGRVIYEVFYRLGTYLPFKNMGHYCYRHLLHEKEAYTHQEDMDYLDHRRFWAFLRK